MSVAIQRLYCIYDVVQTHSDSLHSINISYIFHYVIVTYLLDFYVTVLYRITSMAKVGKEV